MAYGAFNHVTFQFNQMYAPTDYTGHDQFFIGNISSLPITHTGSISLNLPPYKFSLKNFLCVSDAVKNLISVSRFCQSNAVSVEFFSHMFFVKDFRSGGSSCARSE